MPIKLLLLSQNVHCCNYSLFYVNHHYGCKALWLVLSDINFFCKQIVYEFIAVCWKKNLKYPEDMGSGLYQIALIRIPLIETYKHCCAKTAQYLLELIFKDSFVMWHNGWIKWSTFDNLWMFWNKALCPTHSVPSFFHLGL